MIEVTVTTWPYKDSGGEPYGFIARAENPAGEASEEWLRSRTAAAAHAVEKLRQSYAPSEVHRVVVSNHLDAAPE